MDPHPDLPYLAHILDMARTSIAEMPSSGVCIDRQDWLGVVNPDADDGVSALLVNGAWMPVRAMISSWKLAMAAFAQVMRRPLLSGCEERMADWWLCLHWRGPCHGSALPNALGAVSGA
jgi:hypothetical protein